MEALKTNDVVLNKQNDEELVGSGTARFAISKDLIRYRNLNDTIQKDTFTKYTKTQILTYLENPAKNENNLRNAALYMYFSSSHFRRLIQYFVSLTDFAYVVSPYRLDIQDNKKNIENIQKNYNKTLDLISRFDIKNQFKTILTIALREDTFFGTFRETSEYITLQPLPFEYCQISTVENNVPNVSFNFSYFDGSNKKKLAFYPKEFTTKYSKYDKDKKNYKWQELDSPNSFAVKVNKDELSYSVPPFSAVLPALYDLSDYNSLKLTKTELENYAMLVMQMELNESGKYKFPYNKAKQFYKNMDSVLPDQIGSVLSPMKIDKISFDDSNKANSVDTITEAEKKIWSDAGVSAGLFMETSSSSMMKYSIESDQAITFDIVKSIESVVNRYLHSQSYGKNFNLIFINSSEFNKKDVIDYLSKAATLGLPTVSAYGAVLGIDPSSFDGLCVLENDILKYKDGRLQPLSSSYTQSGEQGRPSQETIDTAGEQTEKTAGNEE